MGSFGGTPLDTRDSLLSLTKVRPLQLPPVPACFLCPISQQIMEDPVTAADGVTYEREHIAALIEQGIHDSPTTREKLSSLELRANGQLRAALAGYLDLRRGVENQWQDLESDIHWYMQQAQTPSRWSLRGPSASPTRGTPRAPFEPQAAALPQTSPRSPRPPPPPRPAVSSLRPAVAPIVLPAGTPAGLGESSLCPFQAGPAPRSARGERGDDWLVAERPVAVGDRGASGCSAQQQQQQQQQQQRARAPGSRPGAGERKAFDSLRAVLTLTPRLGQMIGRSPDGGKQTPRSPKGRSG